MTRMMTVLAFMMIAAIAIVGCGGGDTGGRLATDTVVVHDTTVVMDTTRQGADSATATITLPVLDAFFADSSFAADLKSRLGLTDAQVDSLRTVAREETGKLSEGSGDEMGSAMAARDLAMERIGAIIGPEKARALASMVETRWAGAGDSTGVSTAQTQQMALSSGIPTDTRIVVNAPANRMDIFENGQLRRTYQITIGYPEFPLPTGLRTAKTVIFNPTWTPPDEPWVESSKKVKVGKTVPAGSALNPLGIAKIPIGLPSLIHGGKNQAQLGGFGSHGCVGLTDRQMREFTLELAGLTGTQISDSLINAYGKKKTQTQTVDLKTPVPIELRYQTIVVTDGKLHIYRDVYDHNTNNEGNLRAVLGTYNVTMEQLTEAERTQVMAGLRDMSRNARGELDSGATVTDTAALAGKKKPAESAKITRAVKGKKEVVIDVAALKGKGWPAPMDAPAAPSKAIVKK